MGHRVEQAHDGAEVEIHRFDSKESAHHYVTVSRAYVFRRHEPWGFTDGIDFYQGPQAEQRASVRKFDGFWTAAFWVRA